MKKLKLSTSGEVKCRFVVDWKHNPSGEPDTEIECGEFAEYYDSDGFGLCRDHHQFLKDDQGKLNARTVLGARLKKLRQMAGFTQVEHASRAGVSQSRIARMELNGVVELSALVNYLRALGAGLEIVASLHGERIVILTMKASL